MALELELDRAMSCNPHSSHTDSFFSGTTTFQNGSFWLLSLLQFNTTAADPVAEYVTYFKNCVEHPLHSVGGTVVFKSLGATDPDTWDACTILSFPSPAALQQMTAKYQYVKGLRLHQRCVRATQRFAFDGYWKRPPLLDIDVYLTVEERVCWQLSLVTVDGAECIAEKACKIVSSGTVEGSDRGIGCGAKGVFVLEGSSALQAWQDGSGGRRSGHSSSEGGLLRGLDDEDVWLQVQPLIRVEHPIPIPRNVLSRL